MKPSLVKMIIEPLRNDLLTRYLERPDYWRGRIDDKIAEVPGYVDPRECPDEFLQYLKDLVGWTDDLGVTGSLDAVDLRKLITLAIPVWKAKCTEIGLVDLARLLTGKNVVFANWFYFRWILGETGLWEEQAGSDPWILGGDLTSYDEYWSNLRVMDSPDLDHDLLETVVEIERPSNERIEVVYLDFLDWFNEDLRYWTHEVGGAEAYLDETTHRMVIPATGRELITIPWITDFKDATAIVSARRPNDPTVDSFRLRFYVQDVNNCYIAEINPTSLNLISRVGGVESIVATVAKNFFAPQYKLRVGTFEDDPAPGSLRIKVYVDIDLEIDYTTAAPSFVKGDIAIENPNAAADIEADNVEVWERPLEYIVVGPS
jgi:phage tail-like protein